MAKPVFSIGRKPENDLQLLFDTISRQHAEIVFDADGYFLIDKGSSTGTLANGQPVTRTLLHHQDIVHIGGLEGCRLEFLIEASADAATHPRKGEPQSSALTSANQELKRLARFVEVNQAFRYALNPNDVLCLIVDAAIELTSAERGFLMIKNEQGQLEVKVARDRKRSSLPGPDFALSYSIVEKVSRNSRSVIVNDTFESSSLAASQSVIQLDLRTVICVPLQKFRVGERMDTTSMQRPETLGVLYVDSRLVEGVLTRSAVQLLESLAFEASQALENTRLMHQEQEKQRMEREFGLAREVQEALLPITVKPPEYLRVAAQSIPSRYVCGDFYDFITLADGRTVFVIGDVCGKGIAAALLASLAQGVLQAQFASNNDLLTAITQLNRVVSLKTSTRFITLFCALIEKNGTCSFINAGHNPPILARNDGSLEGLTTGSPVVGAFEMVSFESKSVLLSPGDKIVAFTDGVTEAENAAQELFGDDRLTNVVSDVPRQSPDGLKDRILSEILKFTGGAAQSDDITVLVIEFKGE